MVRDEYFLVADPFFNNPQNLCHPFTLELAYRGMDLEVGNSRHFHLWMGRGATIKMVTRVEGLETLNLEDGSSVQCHRLEMSPDLVEYVGVMGKLIQPIVPHYTWWLKEEKPHSQVRYRGPLGQINVIGAPVEVHDLLERKERKPSGRD